MSSTNVPMCFHCGLDVQTGEQFCDEYNGVRQLFCCPACKIVARTIIDAGMNSFYQFRTPADRAPTVEALTSSFDAFDDLEFQHRFVLHNRQKDGSTLATVDLLIGGIHCSACVWLLETHLRRLPGIKRVIVSLSEQKARLEWDTQFTHLSTLCCAIAQIGYQPEPYSRDQLKDLQRRENRDALRRLGVAGIAMMQVGMFAIALYAGELKSIAVEHRDFMRWVSLLVCTPVVFYSARPFFTAAWRGIIARSPGMDLPVAIAIGLAYVASARATYSGSGDVYFDSVTMFTFLLLSGRYLEMRARHFSGRLNANDLSSLLPSVATRITPRSAEQQSVPLFKIKKGDLVLIKPGQVVPADGLITDGSSGVNESQLTGEFMPQSKAIGDRVVAGTLNGEGTLTMRVEACGAQLQLQSINTLLCQGQSDKPAIAQWADRIASYFVVIVLLLAATTYMFWFWQDNDRAFWIMLSVLVVSCPCALSLATPATLIAATSRLRRYGLLVTASQVWQRLPAITHVVCDKTGTLTQGKLAITSIKCLSLLTQSQCLDIAAALEAYSEHPIASAFSKRKSKPVITRNITVATGQGMEGVIDGVTYRIGTQAYTSALYDSRSNSYSWDNGQWVFLSNQYGPLCGFELQDTLRDSALTLVKSLQEQGLSVHMLSGDNSSTARQISTKLGLDHCVYGASPREKLEYIQQLQCNGSRVLMLGDGINDIPVLAAADISIAMCHASNLAKTHADCILLSGNLHTVLILIRLADKVRRIIRQNLCWALVYNLSAIPLAATAVIAPYVAAVGMSLSSLIVVLNALRLQREDVSDEKVKSNDANNNIAVSYFHTKEAR